jgi:CIC family chloride channel protein
VLEELARRFDTRMTIATLGASAGAITVARVLLGNAPDLHIEPLPYPGFGTVPIYLVLGVVTGLLGIVYNRTLLSTLAAAERLRRWPVELRAALIGAAVGLVAWYAPGLVGSGEPLTQRTLTDTESIAVLALVYMLRFGLSVVSYAARTPGGLFAPMLVLGAHSGVLFGLFCTHWYPTVTLHPTALGIVGMAAFFTAVVRAPLTGIMLVTEMTAGFTLLLPMLAACFAAMAVPTMLRQAPIYEALGERIVNRHQQHEGRV